MGADVAWAVPDADLARCADVRWETGPFPVPDMDLRVMGYAMAL